MMGQLYPITFKSALLFLQPSEKPAMPAVDVKTSWLRTHETPSRMRRRMGSSNFGMSCLSDALTTLGYFL